MALPEYNIQVVVMEKANIQKFPYIIVPQSIEILSFTVHIISYMIVLGNILVFLVS